MFPQSLPNEWRKDPKRQSEIKFYDRLCEQLPSDWSVFYDVAWLAKIRGHSPEDGQTDFIVLHPNYGLLLLELKGGGIKYSAESGQWISTDRFGQENLIKDPFRQVERSKYALKNKLSSLPFFEIEKVRLFDAVVFPDVRVGDVQIRMDAPSQVVIDCDDLSVLESKLTSIFKFLQGNSKSVSIPSELISKLTSLLAPTVEFKNPLGAQFSEENEQIIKLTASQFKILDGFRRTNRLAVGGCAGSGKTVLAIQKAVKLAEEGYSTLITCYNRHLAEHLKTATLGITGITVKTFHQLCSDSAKAAGLSLPQIDLQSEGDWDTECAMILCEAMTALPSLKFDAIIVDEAQDFHADWWDALDSALVSSKESILYAFYDDNQKIYGRISELPKEFATYELYDNIRNAQPIFRKVETYYTTNSGRKIEPRGPAGRPVEWFTYKNKTDLQLVLSKLLTRLLNVEQIPSKDIVILTPKSLDERSELLELTMSEDIRLVKIHERFKARDVACSTINRFKGLESDVIIIAELDQGLLKRPEDQVANLMYVGLSRAKNMLVILSHKNFDETSLRQQ